MRSVVFPSFLFLAALVSPVFAGVTLHQDFDNGALMVDQSYVSDDWVHLVGPDNFNSGRWKWIHFRAEGVQGRQLRFRIGDNFASGGSRLSNLRMVYREEGGEWEFFDNNSRNSSAGHFTFYNDAPFTADTVWVAYSFPYPVGRVTSHIEAIRDSPWIHPTASSDGDLVIGMSPGGIDDRGRVVDPLPLYGYMITDADATGQKERIVFCSGVHSNEVLGSHVLEGLVDWLISDDPRAASLRRKVEFFVYPMVNPDGRYAGYNRGNVQWPDRDTNRFWREDLYADMDDIRQVAEAMKRDTGQERVTWLFDFHSWSNTTEHFIFLNPPGGETFFWQELIRLEPRMELTLSRPTAWTTSRFGLDRLNADFGSTPETMFRPGEYPERYLRMGENFGLAIYHEVNPDGIPRPDRNILILFSPGHSAEASVRELGAWIHRERPGEYSISYSADMLPNVLDSRDSLSAGQLAVLDRYDLLLMPRFGPGSALSFSTWDWNDVTVPMLVMNPFTVWGTRWGWIPGEETSSSPQIQDMMIVEPESPVFFGVEIEEGRAQILDRPMGIMRVDLSSSIFTGTTLGWTDQVVNGANREYPWLIVWDGSEPAFYEGGTAAPAGRRALFLSPQSNPPSDFAPSGLDLLLNVIAYTIDPEAVPIMPAGFEAWRLQHFDPSDLGDDQISGPLGDAVGDGVANIVKYFLGLPPHEDSRPHLPRPAIETLSDGEAIGEYFTLAVRRREGTDDLHMRVEISRDLLEWLEEAILIDEKPEEDGYVEMLFRDPLPLPEAQRSFMRMHVEPRD